MNYLFPFSKREFTLAFGVPLASCLIVAGSLAGCNNTEGCGQRAWKEEFWGEPFSGTGFCEETKTDGLLGEKANTLSNFSYMYFGVVVIWIGIADLRKLKSRNNINEEVIPRNAITLNPVSSIVYGVALLYLGFGSFIYHAGGNKYESVHDRAGIFVVFTVLISLSLSLFVQLNSKNAIYQKIAIGILTVFFVCLFVVLNLSQKIHAKQAMTAFLVFSSILLALGWGDLVWRYFKGRNKPTLFSFVIGVSAQLLFIAALTVQERFVPVPCYPNSFFQFHALWHVLTGIGFFVLYLYYRSNHFSPTKENPVDVEDGTKSTKTQTE